MSRTTRAARSWRWPAVAALAVVVAGAVAALLQPSAAATWTRRELALMAAARSRTWSLPGASTCSARPSR